MRQYGVLRYADYSVAYIQSLLDEALVWLAQNLPLTDGQSHEELSHQRSQIEWPSEDRQMP
jgi:hypothetical protein